MAYAPTHDAPQSGLPAYAAPDPTQAPVAQLDPGLDVQLVERRADWAHVVCSNGWEAWVDARRLVARAAPTPEPTPPPPPPAATAPATVPSATTPAPAATTETPPVSTAAPTAAASATQPSTQWSAPASGVPAGGGSGGGVKIGPGQIIALAGAVLVAISAWLTWGDFAGNTASAYEIGSEILIDNAFDAGEGKGLLGIGYLVLLAGALTIVGVFVRQVRFLTIVGGGVAIVIALLFVFQINNYLRNADDELGQAPDLFDFITYMPFLTVVGGAAAIVGGVLALQRK